MWPSATAAGPLLNQTTLLWILTLYVCNIMRDHSAVFFRNVTKVYHITLRHTSDSASHHIHRCENHKCSFRNSASVHWFIHMNTSCYSTSRFVLPLLQCTVCTASLPILLVPCMQRRAFSRSRPLRAATPCDARVHTLPFMKVCHSTSLCR
jgi:hypothetical protein